MKSVLSNPEGLHLRESAFRRYEHILERFLSVYPEPFSFKPAALEPSTVVVGIRNAINAVLTHKYETSLDLTALSEAWHSIHVIVRGDNVIMATPEGQKSAAVEIERDRASRAPTTLTAHMPSEQVMHALCLLIHARIITDPVTLTGLVPHIERPPGIVMEKISSGATAADDTWILF